MSDRLKYERFNWFHGRIKSGRYPNAARLVEKYEISPLQITYHSPHSGKTSTRHIRPLHLMHYMGSWYLLAWCAASGSIRDFALSRITTITPSPALNAQTLKHLKEEP